MEGSQDAGEDAKTDMSNSSGSKDLSKSLPVEAFNNFLQGKRHILVQDFTSAVQSLATACEMYVNHFGELAIECGEVYLLYGKALFRLSQQSAGFLGGALNEGSNEESSSESEEKENESEKNSDEEEGEENETEANEPEKEEKEPSESTDSPQAALDENSSEANADPNSDANVKSNSDAKVESSSEAKAENTSETPTEALEAPQDDPDKEDSADGQPPEAGENKEVNPEETEVEEDDLELAWNTLETAKSIFMRLNTVESQLKVAEILELLAEISMESDNNAAAISDLQECLKIQQRHLQPDDRILAETYYQMGLALMLEKMYPDALENFRTTKSILELRVENLKNTPVDDADGTFASADKEAEITDLENVLLDIKEKIDDTEELIRNMKKELEEKMNEPGVSSPFKEKDETGPTLKPVSNITHLLKRKKPEEITSEDPLKRIKISDLLKNGDSKVITTDTANTEG